MNHRKQQPRLQDDLEGTWESGVGLNCMWLFVWGLLNCLSTHYEEHKSRDFYFQNLDVFIYDTSFNP